MSLAIDVRPIASDELDDWGRAVNTGFLSHPNEAENDIYRKVIEVDRTLGAVDGDQFVGGSTSYGWEITVPGGVLPAALVDAVAVIPTHRRQGVLTRMMRALLDAAHERGEPIAVLNASESTIYGRFGYGIASHRERWTIEREHNAYARPLEASGSIRLIDKDEARKIFPDVYDGLRRERIGMLGFARDVHWDGYLADLEHWRAGASALFHVVYEEERPLGYAYYNVKDGRLTVVQLVAQTRDAYEALWRYCLDVDLVKEVHGRLRATDEELPWLLADPRRLKREVFDWMWLRLVDLRAALAGRTYAQEGRFVVQVDDAFCDWNSGTYVLEGGPDGAECRSTTESPDLVMGASELGSVYLGGVRPSVLARAGRVDERTSGALTRADAMFATDRQPWTPLM